MWELWRVCLPSGILSSQAREAPSSGPTATPTKCAHLSLPAAADSKQPMGLHMDDLHTPSVVSGPTSGASNGVAKRDMSLTELMAEKDRVQGELSALSSVLDSVGSIHVQAEALADQAFLRPAWREHEDQLNHVRRLSQR